MLGLFSKNRNAKKRKAAKHLHTMAYKVYNYRKDVISLADATALNNLIDLHDDLILDSKIESKEYDDCAVKLEKLMRKCGGKIYPMSSWTDNVETIIQVGILVLTIRSFFLQPFKIPTNSMFPSFNGMTAQVYKADESSPNILGKAWRFATLGAWNYSLNSPEDGDLLLEINPLNQIHNKGGIFAYDVVPSKILGLVPFGTEKQYTFEVNYNKIHLNVPADFQFETVIAQAYFNQKSFDGLIQKIYDSGNLVNINGRTLIKLGKVKKNHSILNFDILTGDMLVVDRFTYNFRKPKVGESFVFLTKYCDGMTALNNGEVDDKYYIKRIAGMGGDTLQIKNFELLRNGKPAEGSAAFALNAKRDGLYCGYKQDGMMSNEAVVKIPEKFYYALGDNSANSLDSRYWGFVPEKAVIGKALIVVHPFTERWGTVK